MFRNREVRRFFLLFFLIGGLSAAAGFAIHQAAGILILVSDAFFGMIFYGFTRERYKRIARLSEQIDLVLHNEDCLSIEEAEEGELAILQSEIRKMTLRICEQNEALKREKKHLADSLADIAHQLRTPLTSANIILSLLENVPDEKERKKLLRETEELFAQMDWLLTSLLKLSRLDAGIVVFQREKADVGCLIRAGLQPFLIPMELHDIHLQVETPHGAVISGDFHWLSEALQNIFKNCMESAGDHGKITVACEDNPLFTQISIRDNGAGLSKEDLPRVFDRFYRGKGEKASGYGIGLALSKMIITRQGGTVTAKNHPEGGAVFAVRFPK